MKRSFYWFGWFAGLLAMVGLACNMQQTPTPLPTPTDLPDYCRDTVNLPPLPRPTYEVNYDSVIADYLTQGGSPEGLENMLRGWGAIDDQQGRVDASHDFNGDGFLDVVVTFFYPTDTPVLQAPGKLVVFICTETSADQYRYNNAYGLATSPGTNSSMPRIVYLGDMTADNQPEIMFYVETCNTIACFSEPYILTWEDADNAFRALNQSFVDAYHYYDAAGSLINGFPVEQFEVTDLTGDGPKEVIIHERYISERAAGPHRRARYTWTWYGDGYLAPTVVYDPTNFLIHVVQEADRLLEAGYLGEAVQLYDAALSDPNLTTWGGVYPKADTHAEEEAMLNAYMRYRLVIAHAAQRDGQAIPTLEAMQQDLPWQADYIPSYYTLLAQTFVTAFYNPPEGTTDALRAACQSVVEQAPNIPQTYEYLGDSSYFGYAVSGYTAADLCPF